MDRTSGDGADSAEDSGSSQPYPSTLPGIPKAILLALCCISLFFLFFVFPLFLGERGERVYFLKAFLIYN